MAHSDNGRAGARLLQFKVPGLPELALAITLQEVLEVTELGAITRVPFAPPFVTGLGEWRDIMVTVVDLADLLCKNALQRPYRAAGAHYLIAKVSVDNRLDAIAWSIVSGAGMVNVPTEVPQGNISHELLPQGVYATVAISDTPLTLLNLAGIAEYIARP
ncbi:MAG: chemotaxis protein CheW [Anaerolineae bacterium]|nr:chemotaxis protein CheW [Anaerolineae bacterium]